jgi:hypothetical protein
MLATILKRPYYITRHQELPLRKEREAFLEHLRNQGTSHAALRSICWQMLNVMEHLRLKRMRAVSLEEIKEAAERWAKRQRSNPRARSYEGSARYSPMWRRSGCASRASWNDRQHLACRMRIEWRILLNGCVTRRGYRRCRFSPTVGRRDGSWSGYLLSRGTLGVCG